ncbi:MAG: sigma 54-interacting transcriptional regulator [Gammaproteobacteria bacterium]|nr:sigma 54-interacting transcriptional regulator [Gammaproteobacteria bacterium]
MVKREIRVLVVDDDPGFRRLLTLRLGSEGYRAVSVDSAGAALARLDQFNPDLVITDLRMDGLDGVGLLSELQRRRPALPVLLVTAHGNIADAVTATQVGAVGFLTKPVDSRELREKIAAVLAIDPPETKVDDAWRRDILTGSPSMEALLDIVQRIAPTASSVLIRGDSGTGKELLASAIHRRSGRRGRFVPVNCAAIPGELLESELFGHVKGAFTGATRDHAGLFRQADGGTLFLDEIGEMAPPLQAKLLRVLEEGEVRPVGGRGVEPVDVRVVSATNRDIEAGIASGEFREDLYYRLNTVSLRLPTLTERIEDIPLLVAHRLRTICARAGTVPPLFSADAMAVLVSHDWPGNVRELFNVVERIAVMAVEDVIGPELVRDALGMDPSSLPSLKMAQERFTRRYLLQLLEVAGGNVTRAARLAGRNRTDFYKILARHDIDPPSAGREDRES